MPMKGLSTAMKIIITTMGLLIILGMLLAILRPDLMSFSQSANQSVTQSFANISAII